MPCAAKFVALELASRMTGNAGREIGQHYGRINSAAVSTIRRKIRHGNHDMWATITQLTNTIRKQSS